MTCRDVIERHVSIRRFDSTPIPEEHIREILWAAQRAPSAWGLQPYSIVVVTDYERKRGIAEAVGGQWFITEAPVFLVFLVDYAKLHAAVERLGLRAGAPTLGHIAMALVDIGIASAWATLRAEELGYGTVYIALYSACRRVAEIISAPRLTMPVLGLAIGRPRESPGTRPRQPLEALAGLGAPPDPVKAAEAMLSSGFRTKLEKAAPLTLVEGGYHERVGRELVECARAQGFRV